MKLTKDTFIDETTFKKGCDVSIQSVTDYYNNTCSVIVLIESETVKASRGIGLMDYKDTWTDADVIEFIKNTLNAE